MALVAAKAAGVALAMNYGAHLGSSLTYAKVCMPGSVWDLAASIVTTASPVCSFLLSTMQITQSNYAAVLTTTFATVMSGVLAKD